MIVCLKGALNWTPTPGKSTRAEKDQVYTSSSTAKTAYHVGFGIGLSNPPSGTWGHHWQALLSRPECPRPSASWVDVERPTDPANDGIAARSVGLPSGRGKISKKACRVPCGDLLDSKQQLKAHQQYGVRMEASPTPRKKKSAQVLFMTSLMHAAQSLRESE